MKQGEQEVLICGSAYDRRRAPRNVAECWIRPQNSQFETHRQLSERLMFYTKPKLLIIDELGYLPFERRSAHLVFQSSPAATNAAAS